MVVVDVYYCLEIYGVVYQSIYMIFLWSFGFL